MKKEMSKIDKQLYRVIDEVLFYIWDPIGVSNSPEARDEYFSYIPKMFSLVKENDKIEPIVSYLRDLEIKTMGISTSNEKKEEVAEMLLNWKGILSEKGFEYINNYLEKINDIEENLET